MKTPTSASVSASGTLSPSLHRPNPNRHRVMANQRPIQIARSVALSQSPRQPSRARRTRPPSIGKAGSRLKAPSTRFTKLNHWKASRGGYWIDPAASRPSRASRKLTAGPASAISVSMRVDSGIWLMRAMPPIGQSVMSTTRIPKAIATRLWPSSCSSTQPKRIAKTSGLSPAMIRIPNRTSSSTCSRSLILKTAALGDVLRTTSILPGLAKAHPGVPIAWATAPEAVDLVRTHPLVAEVVALERLAGRRWRWVISLDDEEPLCALASSLETARLSGAYLGKDGKRAYTADVAPWFDMGLLSVHGKAEADRLKVANQKSQPAIYAEMLGIEMG